MLNRFTAIVLLVALVSTNFSRYFVYAGFELNRNYIAAKLCENRDKPWLHCNGRCYFMKKIKAAQDDEKNETRQSQKNLFQEVFFLSSTNIKFHTKLLHVISTPYHRLLGVMFSGAVFRPPQLG
ncbi:hypothetical protein [Mucilaginibacter sp. UR6-11]|uniref:hypothetical protein n=1 Tax=Mucilaginibacter sp. UR6-11 TaxID=1435644 RepID=UPI001E2A36F7|nr:hypothetical protein [Mucilaginibacter sp. UR6-11]MCC8425645.1 hypothetical protein [Mucilaginibacter sp. UR6-11]